MKIRKGVELKYVYIYRDGHAAAVFSQRHAASKTDVEWCEIFEKFAPCGIAWRKGGEYGDTTRPEMTGRIILRGRLAMLVRRAVEVSVWRDNGSEKSRAAGIEMQTLSVELKDGHFSVTNLPAFVSSDFEYQERGFSGETIKDEKFADVEKASEWGSYRIAAVHRVTVATADAPTVDA